MAQRIHNEWFQPIKKTTCQCGCKKTQVFAWGEYSYAKWRTILHFCQECFVSRVQVALVQHAGGCGCSFQLNARSGHSIPEWIKMPEVCKSARSNAAWEKKLCWVSFCTWRLPCWESFCIGSLRSLLVRSKTFSSSSYSTWLLVGLWLVGLRLLSGRVRKTEATKTMDVESAWTVIIWIALAWACSSDDDNET